MQSDVLRVIPARLDQIVDLRHAVLRQGLPRDSAIFPGDDAFDSEHFAAIQSGEVVGCVTLHRNPYADREAWQLRGMAVQPDRQRGGIGILLLRAAEGFVVEQTPGLLLWCNARESATGFYQKYGWKIDSERFIIPDAGPHFRMIRQLALA